MDTGKVKTESGAADGPASLLTRGATTGTRTISLSQLMPKRPYVPQRVMPVFKPAGDAGRVPVGTALLETAGCIAQIDMDEEDRVEAERQARSGGRTVVNIPRDCPVIGAKLHTVLVRVEMRGAA